MGIVAGSYLAVFNSKVVGQADGGFKFNRQMFKRLITGDWCGQAPQDAIYMGMDLTSEFNLLEYDAPAVVDIIRPYNGSTGGTSIHNGQPGMSDVKHGLAKPLVLTSLLTATVLNSSGSSGASTVLPLTRTLPLSAILEGYPFSEVFSPDLREAPIRMRHYPSQHNQATGLGGGVYATET